MYFINFKNLLFDLFYFQNFDFNFKRHLNLNLINHYFKI
jgi:hypothetical protein